MLFISSKPNLLIQGRFLVNAESSLAFRSVNATADTLGR